MATVLTQSYPHSGGYPEIADRDDAGTSTASLSHARPNIIRRETDQILSYYQSEYAGQSHDSDDDHEQRAGLSRRSSSSSRSSSQYSAETTHRIQPVQQAEDLPPQSSAVSVAAGHIRRPSVPSQESVDRRRLAIVELDSSLPPSVRRKEGSGSGFAGGSPQSSLSSRRGIHVNGLALVAPPDASPATYTNLTPPPSAPPVSGNRGLGITPPAAATHSRSASEAIGGHSHLHRKTSRDIGIVGVGRVIPSISETGNQSSPRLNRLTDPSLLHAPIFQTPSKSRSPSPAVQTPDLTENGTPTINSSTPPHFWDPNARDREQTSTPAIGESKDIQQPVVGPVVVGLHSGKVMRREPMHPMDINNASVTTKGSSYSHYEAQPTAGPSLPPPRTMFDAAAAVSSPVSSAPPPRPPRMRTPMPLSQASAPSSSPAKRDLEALKESLQLPQSVSSALASRSPSRPVLERAGTDISNESAHSDKTKESAVSDSALDAKRSRSIHRREGAFPPSNQTTAKSTPEASPVVGQESQDHSNSVPVTTVHIVHPRDPSPESVYEDTEEYDRRSAIELKRDPSWVSLKDMTIASSPNGLGQSPSASRSRSRSRSPAPQPPPKASPGPPLEEMRSPGSSHSGSSNPFKATLNNLKRFSALPRTPSSLSMKSSRTTRTDSTPRSPRTPSPALATTPRNTRPKVVNPWPDAMTFRDVSSMTSPLERASAYAQKIQQLSMCDTGLSEWLQSMQTKGSGPRPVRTTGLQLDIGLSHPSSRSSAAQQQTRHFSGASVASEATFPIRRDAYTATDLMMKPDEDLNLGKPPPIALPYPSLATKLPPPRSSTSVPPTPRSYQIPLSSGPPRSAGGFFSSIGRKASLKKSDSPPAPSRVLTKRSQSRPPQPHVISAPTIPGGPRAPPGKLQRSHTMSVGSAKPVEQPPVSVTRSDTRTSISSRRPSFFHRSAAAAAQPHPPTDEEFEKQVDKLSDLLPHADRVVLAGYLRRAGQDILAIGQYLEDEKKGAIRRD